MVKVREVEQNVPLGHCASDMHGSPICAVRLAEGMQICSQRLHTVPGIIEQSVSLRQPGTHTPPPPAAEKSVLPLHTVPLAQLAGFCALHPMMHDDGPSGIVAHVAPASQAR